MLATTRIGEGHKPVILIHGFLGSGRNLSSLARSWAQADPSLWFLLPDLPGHGTSPSLRPDADLTTMAEEVVATARAHGVEGPLSITGHSLGGRVALAASLLPGKQVEEVTLLDIAPGPIPSATSESGQVLALLRGAPAHAPDRATMRTYFLDQGLSQALTDWLLMNLVHTEAGYTWRIDREALGAFHQRVNRQDLWAAVEHPLAKLRCVRGDRSHYVTDDDKERMERAGCPVVTLENSGHYVHVDQQEKLVRLLAGTLPWR